MKALLIALVVLGLSAVHLFGQAHIVKQRARELSEQNNARQGVTPAPVAPASQWAPTAPQPMIASPAVLRQHDIAQLTTHIASVKMGSSLTIEQMSQFRTDLAAAVRGSAKPSPDAVKRLGDNLVAALASVELPAAAQGRVAQNLQSILNCGGVPTKEVQAVITDTQATLQRAGVERKAAVAVANDLKTISGEIQKSQPK